MNKSIREIELDYIRNIIEFFCREYLLHINFNKQYGYKQAELKELISKKIQMRLVNSNLLKDYKVEINVYPVSEKRNCQIENLLEDKSVFLEDNITIFYERTSGEIYEYKYKL
jgi:hypothetical protein